MIQKPILFICCMALFLSDMAFAAEKTIGRNRPDKERIALIIGNGAYTSVQRLTNPPNDAMGMADTLGSLGFDVTVRTNLGYREMSRVISDFGERLAGSGGVGLFYFSGHGAQADGENYLIPVNSDIRHERELRYKAVSAGLVLAQMENARNSLNIIILDACRNNPFAGKFKSLGRSGLASMDAPVGTVIAYATAPGKTASEGPGRYSIYTHSLLQQMKISGVEIGTMFRNIRRKVVGYTSGKQVPWEASSLMGEFYFAGGSTVVTRTGTGRLSLETSPSGATVWINGRSRGRSPIAEDGLEPGQVRVRAALDGYRDEETTLRIRRGETTRVTLYLDRLVTTTTTRPTTTIAARPGEWRDPVTGMDFVFVKGGCYEMGCRGWTWIGDCRDDEKPVHTVCVDDFYMGKYEVTQGQWKRIMGSNPSDFKKGDNYPVEDVSWSDAKQFLQKLNAQTRGQHEFRLPTETEWEYACHSGGKPEKYCGGDNVDRVAWYSGNSGGSTHPVGTKAPNGLGIYDMSGNVWEWCKDVYAKDAYGKHRRNNPTYTDSGSDRVERGGSWNNSAGNCRSANRNSNSPGNRDNNLGLRLAFSPGQQ